MMKKRLVFPDFRSNLEQDSDSLFHETDPRIRIHIKIKRIRNTDIYMMLHYTLYTPSLKKLNVLILNDRVILSLLTALHDH